MSFKAKNNDCGGTNSDNGATGATCHAFVKVLTPSYAEQLMVKTETTGASTTEYETMNVDYELVADHVGSILQTGFMSYAGNYAPTSVLYDDVELAAYTPTPAPAPTPAPEDGTLLSETMADYSACLLYTSPSPRDTDLSRMPSSA